MYVPAFTEEDVAEFRKYSPQNSGWFTFEAVKLDVPDGEGDGQET